MMAISNEPYFDFFVYNIIFVIIWCLINYNIYYVINKNLSIDIQNKLALTNTITSLVANIILLMLATFNIISYILNKYQNEHLNIDFDTDSSRQFVWFTYYIFNSYLIYDIIQIFYEEKINLPILMHHIIGMISINIGLIDPIYSRYILTIALLLEYSSYIYNMSYLLLAFSKNNKDTSWDKKSAEKWSLFSKTFYIFNRVIITIIFLYWIIYGSYNEMKYNYNTIFNYIFNEYIITGLFKFTILLISVFNIMATIKIYKQNIINKLLSNKKN